MNLIKGNLLEIQKGILAQQVNCFRVMGAGLALQIKLKWPHVYDSYRDSKPILGNCLLVRVHEGLYVANLYGQNAIGGLSAEAKKTNYGALANALNLLRHDAAKLGLPIYIPMGMSSGLAGGDWMIVKELIEFFLPNATLVQFDAYDRLAGRINAE